LAAYQANSQIRVHENIGASTCPLQIIIPIKIRIVKNIISSIEIKV